MTNITRKRSLQEWRARPKKVAAAFPSQYTCDYITGDLCQQKYGHKLSAFITVYTETEIEAVSESKEEYQAFASSLIEKFIKQPDYLDYLIRFSEERINSLYLYLKEHLSEEIIATLSNNDIADRYLVYVDLYRKFHLEQTPSWFMGGQPTEAVLKKYLTEKGVENVDIIMANICQSLEYFSENLQEEFSLLDIAIKLQEKYSAKIPDNISDIPTEIHDELTKHTQEFFSIPFGYKTGVVWDMAHFFGKLRELLSINPLAVKEGKINSLKEKTRERDALVAKLSLPTDIYSLVIALRKLTYIQELKKTTQTRSHPLLQLVVKKEIADRLRIDVELVDYMDENEIVTGLRSRDIDEDLKNNIAERNKYSVLIIEDMMPTWLVGDQAREFVRVNDLVKDAEDVKEFKGTVASRGMSTGRACICRTSNELSKVKDGDVLITAMTTPDFVPAMRRASAIITDEGGVTCHAAIISRELGKPCIIGTKIATKVLKDGDMVEVDAEKGIVKKVI